MDICKKLYAMKKDEAGGILAYNKLKNEIPPEHKEHIDTIEMIIGDEYDHLQDIENIMKEMECKDLVPKEEIILLLHFFIKDIKERTDEIEKVRRTVEDKDISEKIQKIMKDIEKVSTEIDNMTNSLDI